MADGSGATRLPAHDLDAEAAVISSSLHSREAFDQAREVVRSEQFYADANRRIWESMVALDDAGKPVDVVTVATRLRELGRLEQVGGTAYLAQISDATPSVLHVRTYAETVRDAYRQRQMVAACQQAVAEGYGPVEDVRSWLLDKAQSVASVAEQGDTSDPPETLAELMPRVGEALRTRQGRGGGVTGVDTGWTRYTALLGGLRRGKAHVLGARPSMGKSSVALCEAINVARQGLGAIFVSLEMDKDELALRALSVETRLDGRDLAAGRLSADDWRSVTAAQSALSKLPLSIVYRPGATVGEIRSVVRQEQARLRARGFKELGLVVVDYLQLMNGERRASDTRETEIAALMRRLTWMAAEFNAPLRVLSQLNRGLESRANSNKRPTLADLRESGSIEQDAYTVTFLYRDDYYHQGSEQAGTIEFIVAKNRGGPTGTAYLAFHAPSTSVGNLEHEATAGWDGYTDA